ncbi:MAG: hypothetical protein IH850_12840 [Acidobacteria bacterium]|nr:hypothetical protein [Acidobacteriota bacterium]
MASASQTNFGLTDLEAVNDLDFANADPNASSESLDDAAAQIRSALVEMGYESSS